uniref:EOG090X0J8E n=1 Tax=Moina brachiata TaxID=675436 RepID=A0A4Y7NJG4_9CRUS|nr:EOG090X0J8E [Moina brachiata]SVE93381.1 EOG090X0J8E [Moina brachiata]
MDKAIINTSVLGPDSKFVVNDNLAFGGKGSSSVKSLSSVHPLEKKLSQHDKKQEEISMNILKNIQGMHAPLRLHMEKQALKLADAGHLPCLYRHNASMDALTGRDMRLDFEDFLATPFDSEVATNPQLAIERHLNIF